MATQSTQIQPKPTTKASLQQDSRDARLWRKVISEQDGVTLRQSVTSEYKTSRFLITKAMIAECAKQIESGVDPDSFNPKLLFFAMQLLPSKFRLLVASIARKRRENREFDQYGDWKRTDALLVNTGGQNEITSQEQIPTGG